MLGGNKNLKDTPNGSIKDTSPMLAPYQAFSPGSGSYSKSNKLITALYMVTDILDKDEPLRNKLRTLGVEIISDIYTMPRNVPVKISEVMSFLDIASAVNIISEMNCNILRKEFSKLGQSIEEYMGGAGNKISAPRPADLSGFFYEEMSDKSIGHPRSARIGVQKGSTLMKALSRVEVSDKDTKNNSEYFALLKKQRREEITNLIQKGGGKATITDIKGGAYGSLASCGEKTLQRELVSMVKDGVLKKTGEKRWSRYFVI